MLARAAVKTMNTNAAQQAASPLSKPQTSKNYNNFANATSDNPVIIKADSGVVGPSKAQNLPKVGRNEACPCGSGKKFKKCCG